MDDIPQTPDPKGVAHHQADELAVQLLCVPFGDEGIYQSPLFRRSRPAVTHMRPLWGLSASCFFYLLSHSPFLYGAGQVVAPIVKGRNPLRVTAFSHSLITDLLHCPLGPFLFIAILFLIIRWQFANHSVLDSCYFLVGTLNSHTFEMALLPCNTDTQMRAVPSFRRLSAFNMAV